ncbi:MAG: DUF6165 family protein [Candidatus Fermentibacteraceae bacterium]
MRIEVSIGEVADKLSILQIKLEKFGDPEKRANVRRELESLEGALEEAGVRLDPAEMEGLRAVNLRLWEIEDDIRRKEARKEFDEEFVRLARSVYFSNDERARLKREINLRHGSDLIEEKEYADYGAEAGDPSGT